VGTITITITIDVRLIVSKNSWQSVDLHIAKIACRACEAAVRSLCWVSGYRTDRVDSIKLFSSYRQNMISGRFRSLRWVLGYFFLHIAKI
jgi:hypothetical protein